MGHSPDQGAFDRDSGVDSDLARRLVGRIDLDRLVARSAELVRIPSVNPFGRSYGDGDGYDRGEGERAVAEYLGNHLADLGWATATTEVEPGRPNVWGVRPGRAEGATVLLAGHTDTVGVANFADDPFSGAIRDGRLHGRGSCDMKAALAAFMELATVLEETGAELGGDLVIAGLVDEEHKMLGSRSFAIDGPTADYAILGEPTGLRPCPAHLGQYSVVITTRGRASHSSIPEHGVNAIEHMARVIEELGRYRLEILDRPPHHLCGTGRISPGVINGGEIVAIVPDLCHLEVDRRLTPDDRTEDVVSDLRRHLDPLTDADPEFRYEISPPTWDIPALDTPVESPVTKAVCGAARRMGLPSTPVAFPAATDGPNLGIPTVVCGPGAIEDAHTVTESVDLREVQRAVELYAHAVVELTGGPGASGEIR